MIVTKRFRIRDGREDVIEVTISKIDTLVFKMINLKKI